MTQVCRADVATIGNSNTMRESLQSGVTKISRNVDISKYQSLTIVRRLQSPCEIVATVAEANEPRIYL